MKFRFAAGAIALNTSDDDSISGDGYISPSNTSETVYDSGSSDDPAFFAVLQGWELSFNANDSYQVESFGVEVQSLSYDSSLNSFYVSVSGTYSTSGSRSWSGSVSVLVFYQVQ